jgi:diguanylate cyclase (GGDEF)-like protein
MYAQLARKALGLTWPILLPLAAAGVLLHWGGVPPGGLSTVLPRLALALAIALAWRFNRSRIVFAAVAVWAAGEAVLTLPPGTARAAVTVCLPLTLLVFALVQERGLTTPIGWARWAFLGVQVLGVLSLRQAENAALGRWLGEPVFALPWFLHPGLAKPGILAFLLVLLVLGWRMSTSRSAIDTGLFGALVGGAFVLHTPGGDAERLVYLGAVGVILLITMVEASYTLAYRDELTGLPGRRALNETLQQLGGTYTLAMADVDHFKKFNDSYGHDAGDQCLRYVAAHLAAVGGGGRAFRYGGEEFTILFPGKTVDEALEHLEALRAGIADAKFAIRAQGRPKKRPEKPKKPGPIKSVSVTVSLGACERDPDSDDLRDAHAVMEKADKRLYKSKKDGRNRVTAKGC